MARGALERLPADVAVAVTGVAGPDPDEDGNPVGLVHIAAASRAGSELHVERRLGQASKDDLVQEAMRESLILLLGFVAA
jgi:nicotinamide-nucleotide amidase